MAPNTTATGVYLQIADAGACQITLGNSALPAGQFSWINYQNGNPSSPVDVQLNAGIHSLALAGLTDAAGVDQVLLLSDKTCVPSGDGSNCSQAAVASAPTPQPVLPINGSSSTPVPVAGIISLAPVNLPSNVKSVKYYVDGHQVSSSQVDVTKLADGNHTVETRVVDANGKEITYKGVITVNNHQPWPTRALDWARRYWLAEIIVLAIVGGGLWFGISRRRSDYATVRTNIV